MHPYLLLVEQWKTIAHFPGWSEPEPETGHVWFDAPLDIGEITEAGLFLHGSAQIDAPDQHVTFELVARNVNARRRGNLIRLEWRSPKGGHRNPRNLGPKDLAGRRVSATTRHCSFLYWIAKIGSASRRGRGCQYG